MTMTPESARASVKRRLDLKDSDTTFDDSIDEFVLSGVKRLSPIALRQLPVQEVAATVDSYGEAVIDLSTLGTPAYAARKIQISSGTGWYSHGDFEHQETDLYITDLPTTTATVRVFGLGLYTLETVPEHFEMPVIWYAMSEFYDYLAGNKRKYNSYMNNGAREVDNMNDLADFYEQKANVYLNDRVQIHGSE